MSSPFVLIPVKSLAAGKSRLAGLLEPGARRSLNQYFLRKSLATAIDFTGPERCAIVSPCDEVLKFARSLGVHAIRQCGPEGLNPGVTQGLRELRYQGAGDVIVISSDVPNVLPSDFCVANDLGKRNGTVVIGADRHGVGTNLLFVPAGVWLRFQFGAHSLVLHVQEARRVGGEPLVHVNERIGFDVDTPDDFQRWEGYRPNCSSLKARE